MKRWFTVLFSTLWLIGCQSTSALAPKTATYHSGFDASSTLAHFFHPPPDTPTHYSGFYPLAQGSDALLARLALIESASTSLELQYYIFRDDETSQLLIWRIFEAAERGVKVRLLLDDMQNRKDSAIAYLNGHPNIEIRLFNPHQHRYVRMLSWVTDGSRLNRRMHNKSLTADGVVSIVGGRNIGNEYFSFRSDVEFGDFDLLLYGPVVEQTQVQFDHYWNSDFAVPMAWIHPSDGALNQQDVEQWRTESQIEHQFSNEQYSFKALPLYRDIVDQQIELYWGEAVLLYDLPEKIDNGQSQLIDGLAPVLADIEHSVVIVSPYFVPTETGTQALIEAAKQGKKITILTNSLASNDVFAVHGWYAKYREKLVKGNIELWEMKAHAQAENPWSVTGSSRSSLHAKVILLDKRKIFVGSMNIDPRSAELNTEMAVVFEHPQYVSATQQELLKQLQRSAYKLEIKDDELIWRDYQTGQILESEPDAGWLLRSGAWLSGLLPIESLL
ncbi:cardiolipin synthetase [Vibrio panuliri]|uniref:Cardiolipin synthetase n=1 Tax=Vibrio panuliri TaxID=1381081 RepID=A0A1Q9HRT0_9VIBR|nr:phospholipase D family protein [Vibrio panuliri]OLQ93584.1 cardiolipin synthetase [Vibrio panuliri]